MVIYKKQYCQKCKKKTEHLKCGFGRVGGLSGNGRLECKKCRGGSSKLLSILVVTFALMFVVSAITITQITPTGDIVTTNSSILIQYNFTTDYLNNLTFNWDGTGYSLYDDSLVLFYNFDNRSALGENDTVVKDLSKYGNNGTVVGGENISWTSSGKYGGAYEFSGNMNYIDANSIGTNYNTDFSVGFWFYAKYNDSTTYFPIVVDDKDSSNKAWDIRYRNNLVVYSYTNGSGTGVDVSTTSKIYPNNWNHIVIVTNRVLNMTYFYVNGNNEVNRSLSGWQIVGSTRNLNIGSERDGASAGRFFNGTIDYVMIFNRSLSSSEISQLYNSQFTKYDSQNWSFQSNQSLGSPNSTANSIDFTYNLCSSNSTIEICSANKVITQTIPISTIIANFTTQVKSISSDFYGVNYQSEQGLISTDEQDSDGDCSNDEPAEYLINRQILLDSGIKNIRWTIYLENKIKSDFTTQNTADGEELVKFAYDNGLKIQLIASRMPLWLANTSSSYCNSTYFYGCPINRSDYSDFGNATLSYLNNVTNNGMYISAIDSIEIFNEPDGGFLPFLSDDNVTTALEYVRMFNDSYMVLNASYPNLTYYGISSTSPTSYTVMTNTFFSNLTSLINGSDNIGVSMHSYWRYLYGGTIDKVYNQTDYLVQTYEGYGIKPLKISVNEWNYNKDDGLSFTNLHGMGTALTYSQILNIDSDVNLYLYKWGADSSNSSCKSEYNFTIYNGVTNIKQIPYNVTSSFAHLCPAGGQVYTSSSDDSDIKIVSCKDGDKKNIIVINTGTESKNVSLDVTNSDITTLDNYLTAGTYSITDNIAQLGVLDSYEILYLTYVPTTNQINAGVCVQVQATILLISGMIILVLLGLVFTIIISKSVFYVTPAGKVEHFGENISGLNIIQVFIIVLIGSILLGLAGIFIGSLC